MDSREGGFDLFLGNDQRRREQQGIGARSDQDTVLEAAVGAFGAACARRSVTRLEIDGGEQADVADVDDVRRIPERMRRSFPKWSNATADPRSGDEDLARRD